MKIVIPGGRGQVGALLARAFLADGHEVVFLSRQNNAALGNDTVLWDGKTPGAWMDAIEGADILINLAGRSVNCRYNKTNRQEIMDSRIKSTQVLAEAFSRLQRPPALWLQASTATIYAHTYEPPNDEYAGKIGGSEPGAPDTWRFSIEVATNWEKAFDNALLPRTRKIKLRSAMTMSPDTGGVFDTLLSLVRKGLGGQSGNGRQYVSWIHEHDFVRAIYWLINHDQLEGAINICSPNPLPNAEFMRILRQSCGIKFGLPATEWMLELGAIFLRTETELVLKSRRVIPKRLLESGFQFQFKDWTEACAELCQRWCKTHD